MNRRMKRLSVNKETLRSLSKEDLPKVAGGTFYTDDDCEWSVPVSFCRCPSQVICSKGGSCHNGCD